MTNVVATHAVGDIDTWLGGGETRAALFATFSSSYRIFKHTDKNFVSIVWEDVDVEKMKEMLGSPQAAISKTKHTVIDPIEVYIEIASGS